MAHITFNTPDEEGAGKTIPSETNYSSHQKQLAHVIWQAGVRNCHGTHATFEALKNLTMDKTYAILSIGKAAVSMTLGAHKALGTEVPSLTLTKTDHIDKSLQALMREHEHINAFESSHPMPDESSLKAGQMAKEFVKSRPSDTCLIMLISGGASALCELLIEGVSLEDLQDITKDKLRSGATIEEINAARSEVSLIKQGKILNCFPGREVKALLISDVAGEDVTTIASGTAIYPTALPPDTFHHEITLLRTNQDGRVAAEKLATSLGLNVIKNEENLYGDVYDRAAALADTLKNGPEGIYIFGGEPTVQLPDQPGEGGRAQCLALALAKEIYATEDLTCLIAGSDGTDGPTIAAGGLIDGTIFNPSEEADRALSEANAGAFLRAHNALYITGATGTNVMDFAICVKLSEEDAKRALTALPQGS